jgi:DNA-binding response OmpR family regulator
MAKKPWTFLNKFNPDLVIVDIMMPKLDGLGVTKEIRKHHDTPRDYFDRLGRCLRTYQRA